MKKNLNIEKQGNKVPEVETTALVKVEPQMTVISAKEEESEKVKHLEEEVLKLRAKLSQEPQDLEEKIQYYQEKQKKIEQLEKLTIHRENLESHQNKLKEIAKISDFECTTYELKITAGYKDTPPLAINNPALISELITFVINKISDKTEALKLAITQ